MGELAGGARTARLVLDRGRSEILPFEFGPENLVGEEPRHVWRVSVEGRGLAGAWVTLRFLDEDSSAFSRLQLAVVSRVGSGLSSAALPVEATGHGHFSWVGRLPSDLVRFEFVPLAGEPDDPPTDFAVVRHGTSEMLGRAFLRRPDIAAVGVLWRVLGKRVRGRNYLSHALAAPPWFGSLLGHPKPLTGYDAWVHRFDTVSEAGRERMRAEIAAWADPPLISVVMPVYNPDPKVLEAALRSLSGQLYPRWELCVADDASTDAAVPRLLERFAAADPRVRLVRRQSNGHIARATNDALARATGPFVAFMDHDDLLPENALFEVAKALVATPELDLVYSDEDKVDARGRRFEPHFKPDWNVELLYAQNYVNHLTVIRTALVREVGGLRPGFEGSQDHDLLLRLVDRLDPARVRHIPRVLYHWRAAIGSGTFSDRSLARAEAARLAALGEVLEARGAGHRVERGPLGFNRLVRALPDPAPLVSVIIPTRDRAELLDVTLRGLLTETEYPRLEVVILDNDSVEPATKELFARFAGDSRVRVLPSPGAFNFSGLSNQGAAAARGEVLLFLNNDVEVIEPHWLRELASIALEPHVGAVGAKLYYPDFTLQHGGVILGAGGVAGHSHLGISREDPGYFARMAVSQEVSAVTGACLATRRSVFEEVGGFDAVHLTVAFNDIDLCLRITEAGYRIVWTPHAALIHHESKSRGLDDTPEKRRRFEGEVATMLERWGPRLRRDPHYNPNLARASAQFRLW